MKPGTGERLETFIIKESTVEHLHRYAIAKELSNRKIVVDIACGEGYGSNLIATVAQKVIGIDTNENVIKKAKEKYISPNISFMAGNVEKIPLLDNVADMVVSFETIEHLENHDGMLLEIKRILKPEGLLLISTPDKKYYSDKTGYINHFHKKELYQEEFRLLLRKYFPNLSLYLQFRGNNSLIIPEKNEVPVVYSGSFNTLKKDSFPYHSFLIALASNNELPEIRESYFSSANLFYDAGTQQILRSPTYKTGNFLLLPFKKLRNLFKNK